MLCGYPLFPGRSDIDQLFKIFQKRGTPHNDTWPNCTELPHYNTRFPQWRHRPIQDFLVSASSMSNSNGSGTNNNGIGGCCLVENTVHAADLLEKLLHYDPEMRIVCKNALQHPFFFE